MSITAIRRIQQKGQPVITVLLMRIIGIISIMPKIQVVPTTTQALPIPRIHLNWAWHH